MYHCSCHTCELDQVYESFETAQEVFNDHADRRHEVELERIEKSSGFDQSTDRSGELGGATGASASKGGAVGDE